MSALRVDITGVVTVINGVGNVERAWGKYIKKDLMFPVNVSTLNVVFGRNNISQPIEVSEDG
ncbi:hypothetical protein L6R44_11685 [Enterobacter cloacae complex sp. ECC445]|uniref:hypothetical protein n=1 Tax=Enterobacter cloacae complex TaxID=354276 RepID=UPI001299F5B6|nr:MULTISPECIES: hypothetical protein [Enterobacter cloacae complex]MCG0456757.1 hypothetical protein [Enterobacter cloacae complex sp. ECC445]MRG34138.1 hypothetical protein [Enterobacter cancerogenus]QZY39522.1 hypothetical protein HU826_24375 [Enterobacter cancerogenus]